MLLQIQHHPFRILIQPLTGPHAVQSKGRQNSRRLLGRLPTDRRQQIRAQTAHQPVEPLLQRQMPRETEAVEAHDQRLERSLTQAAPTRLTGQSLTPLQHLLTTDPRGISDRRLVLGPTQQVQLTGEPHHLAPQRIVLRQQRLHVAGDPLLTWP